MFLEVLLRSMKGELLTRIGPGGLVGTWEGLGGKGERSGLLLGAGHKGACVPAWHMPCIPTL